MLVDMAWIVVLVLVGLAFKLPFPQWRWPARPGLDLHSLALGLLAASMLCGWLALYSLSGVRGLTEPEPTPRAVRTVSPR